jgi:hypothetical protein
MPSDHRRSSPSTAGAVVGPGDGRAGDRPGAADPPAGSASRGSAEPGRPDRPALGRGRVPRRRVPPPGSRGTAAPHPAVRRAAPRAATGPPSARPRPRRRARPGRARGRPGRRRAGSDGPAPARRRAERVSDARGVLAGAAVGARLGGRGVPPGRRGEAGQQLVGRTGPPRPWLLTRQEAHPPRPPPPDAAGRLRSCPGPGPCPHVYPGVRRVSPAASSPGPGPGLVARPRMPRPHAARGRRPTAAAALAGCLRTCRGPATIPRTPAGVLPRAD